MRKTHRNSLVLCLLALSLGLRSLIAPGFMLNTDGDGLFGLSITLCGSAGELAVFDDPHQAHTDANVDQHDHDHDHDAAGGLLSNTCGLWSTSATYVQFITIDTDHLLQVFRDEFQIDYHSPSISVYHRLQQQPRAPPATFII